jgi:hypothetical protein
MKTGSRTSRAARWRLLAVFLAAGAALYTQGATAAPLVSAASNKCLTVTGASQTPGTDVQISDCNGQASQDWTFTSAGEVRVFNNTRCLDAFGAGTAAGTRLIIWNCSGAQNQRFTLNGNGTLTGAQSGLCADVIGAATANGTRVALWSCNGQSNQRWSTLATPNPNPNPNPNPSTCTATPVDPQATPQARRLLCYIYSQYGNHILSGQQESTWVSGPDYEMNYIRGITGKLPAIRGLDMGDSPNFASRAIAWWNAGGIPMVGYHMGAPGHQDGHSGSLQTANINQVLMPGTSLNAIFMQRLDAAAAQLQQAQAANVPIIWRPFHEAGGTWFWWSKEGGAQYNRLWRFMFDYYTRVKGLHNLIWMHPYNGSPQASFYPGRQYVDIGGADTYANNHNPLAAMFNTTRSIYGTTIPIALHENGPIPDPDQLQSQGVRWVLFNTWHSTWITNTSLNPPALLNTYYNHAYVITRDEVPNLR